MQTGTVVPKTNDNVPLDGATVGVGVGAGVATGVGAVPPIHGVHTVVETLANASASLMVL